MVKVRIAPSPTGYLHVGTARTALYNFLFARKHNGKFVLRIEDTDVKRSTEEMVNVILDSLTWLGLKWDEGPFFQSDNLKRYQEIAKKILEDGKAYYCYCTQEEIEERKRIYQKTGKVWKYDRRCLHLKKEEKERFEREGRKKAIRFIIPEGKTSFHDLIHGEIEMNNSEIEDFVIMKSDGFPSYNFAVVVDDHDMGITHVIRGDDHIPNTPKQILLYDALSWDKPEFAHLPLILGEDRSKLSKRHGVVAVSYYRDEGILSEAFVNFLALLGWSPKDEREFFTMDELIREFDIKNVGKRGAVFDIKKLLWMNSEYIRKLSIEELMERIEPYLIKSELIMKDYDKGYLKNVLTMMKERLQTLRDLEKIGYYFFKDDYKYEGIEKILYEGIYENLSYYLKRIELIDEWRKDIIEKDLRIFCDEKGISTKKIIHPVRIAITGITFGPGLFEIMEILGKENVIKRVRRFLEFLKGG
uniref:Glutamate--tRNA ligase n=1 Tax=candidate division WOR-3 bacterium TaxID=2052148 RepID=A0A7C4UD85_UNCW3